MKNKIAIVAGASRGAGKGIALALAEEGYLIYILGRTRSKSENAALGSIDQTADEVNQMGGKGIPYAIDCSDFDQLQKFFKLISAKHDQLNVLVNSAWGGHDKDLFKSPLFSNPNDPWEYMMNRGVKNYFLCTCAASKMLSQSEHSLVANISFWDDGKYTGSLVYDLAKNAMNRLALGFHHEFAGKVTCVSLSPGYMLTERVKKALDDDPSLAEQFGVPTESPRYVGRAVTALAGDPACHQYSGKTLRVADLALKYDFRDADGNQPGAFRLPTEDH